MILKKTIINGKDVYEPISYEDALVYNNKDELLFTSDDEKDEFEDKVELIDDINEKIEDLNEQIDNIIEELDDTGKSKYFSLLEEKRDMLNDLKKNYSTDTEDTLDKIEDELDEIEDEINKFNDEGVDFNDVKIKNNSKNVEFDSLNGQNNVSFERDFKDKFSSVFDNIFNGKKNNKMKNIIFTLPFMSKNDLHELVEKILNDDEKYKELNIVVILPFLDKEYCDQLFMRFVLEGKACKHSIVTIVPFVSKTCLSKFVDEYINGKYQDVEMNMLYQFLDSEDVKKVFNYILSKTND